jgi:hypothetical protein
VNFSGEEIGVAIVPSGDFALEPVFTPFQAEEIKSTLSMDTIEAGFPLLRKCDRKCGDKPIFFVA